MSLINSFGTGPSSSAFSITPDDDNDITYPIRALYVGTGGDLQVILQDDTAETLFANVLGGSCLPLQIKRVMASGTAASDLVGLR
jgi:hypothetical protein